MAYPLQSKHPEQAGKFLDFLWERTETVCYLGCPFHDPDADACTADLPQPCLELKWFLSQVKIKEM